ncbi:DedA family protein [Leptolyngbya sp. AN02str]|uniref:DedA family protein n=1 Tax=Leptolyngbya sp. AN02str TaxID=3423363 RepID=UPI003D31D45B
MLDWITTTIATFNYWGIALLMLLENIFPPIPSELIMPLAGFTVTQGKLNFVWVIVAGTVGSILGAFPWFYIGRRVGEQRLQRWVDRHGKWLALSGEDIDKSKRWFDQYGGVVVLFGRLVPGIRTLISVPAGFEEMPWAKFLLYSLVGTVAWNILLTYAGILLGQNYQLIEKFLGPISGIVLVGLLIFAGVWIMKRKQRRKKQKR